MSITVIPLHSDFLDIVGIEKKKNCFRIFGSLAESTKTGCIAIIRL